MHGKNPVRKADIGDGQTLWVQEVFHTIQGEGPLAGTPAVFVRLAGCNLRCHFCDTEFESSTWKPTLDELVAKINTVCSGPTSLVVLTGGEPLRQNIAPLTVRLHAPRVHERFFRIQVETAGTLPVPQGCWIDDLVVSPKTRRIHPDIASAATAYKYVLRAGEVDPVDGLPNKSTQILGQDERICRPWPEQAGCVPAVPVFIQPCDEGNAEANARNLRAASEVCMKHGYRLSVQVHKIAGLP
jgi:organic radical activating enzyme